jgi:hypothetical protein
MVTRRLRKAEEGSYPASIAAIGQPCCISQPRCADEQVAKVDFSDALMSVQMLIILLFHGTTIGVEGFRVRLGDLKRQVVPSSSCLLNDDSTVEDVRYWGAGFNTRGYKSRLAHLTAECHGGQKVLRPGLRRAFCATKESVVSSAAAEGTMVAQSLQYELWSAIRVETDDGETVHWATMWRKKIWTIDVGVRDEALSCTPVLHAKGEDFVAGDSCRVGGEVFSVSSFVGESHLADMAANQRCGRIGPKAWGPPRD